MKKLIIPGIMALLLLSLVVVGVVIPDTLASMIDRTSVVTNSFVPDEDLLKDLQVPIYAKKIVTCTGDETISPENFTFVLTNTETGEELCALSAASGQVQFDLAFDGMDVGVYNYTLHEQNNGREGITYSELVYDVQVQVLTDPLRAEVTVNGEDASRLMPTFENLYTQKIPETGDRTPVMACVTVMCLSAVLMAAVALGLMAKLRRSRG